MGLCAAEALLTATEYARFRQVTCVAQHTWDDQVR